MVAICLPQVMSLAPVASSSTAAAASGNDEGLKMCARRPFFSHVISSFAAKPPATIANWRNSQSSRNQRKRLMLKMTGNGPNPNVYRSRLDQASSMSKA